MPDDTNDALSALRAKVNRANELVKWLEQLDKANRIGNLLDVKLEKGASRYRELDQITLDRIYDKGREVLMAEYRCELESLVLRPPDPKQPEFIAVPVVNAHTIEE